MVHLVGLLVDLIVLVGARREQLLGALHEQQRRGQRADGVSVATHHHVREPHIVGRRDLTRRHVRVLGLLVQLYVLQDLQLINSSNIEMMGKKYSINSLHVGYVMPLLMIVIHICMYYHLK